jgi:hypothetical protein
MRNCAQPLKTNRRIEDVRSDGLGGTATTNLEYPTRLPFVLLGQLLEDFVAQVGVVWQTCLKPESIPTRLPRFKIIWMRQRKFAKAIDSVLEPGVKLVNLVERSNDFLAENKMFYKQEAKKTNSCCVIS